MVTRSAMRRWALPAGAAALVIGWVAVGPVLGASAEEDLPDRSAEQLVSDLLTAEVDGLSGTISQRADLGLPALPDTGESTFTSLLTGSHTLLVWYAGPDQSRVALLGTLGESDTIRNGADVWAWSSADNTATHATLPAAQPLADLANGLPPATPQQAAAFALAALDESTDVTTGPTVTVAGRPAYQLVITPKDAGSLVASVRVAVDGTEHVPTRVEVYAVGSDRPALEVGFTDIDFTVPDADVFAFTPPPGATVEDSDLAAEDHARPEPRERAGEMPGQGGVAVVGQGWSSVLVARVPAMLDTPDPGSLGQVLAGLPTVSGSWGSGRLLTSRLVSVLLTDDGRVLIGAVDGDALQAAAADPAAALG